jgi:zinc transport system substrate-binding protein
MQAGLKIMSKWYLLFSFLYLSQVQAEVIRPLVFVSIPPQKQIIERLAGEYVDVHIMLSPGQSPETYAPTPRQIVTLASATSYFQIGVPFEVTWTDAIRSASPNIRIINCCESILKNIHTEQSEFRSAHNWTDPILAIEIAKLARNELVDLLPEHENQLMFNFLKLEDELHQLHMEIEEKLDNKQTAYFIITHSALDAFANRYNLKQLALDINGREIGLNSLMEMIKLGRQDNIRTLFVIEQYRSPLVLNLADELNAEVVELDILAENYIDNMFYIAEQIARSLQAQ